MVSTFYSGPTIEFFLTLFSIFYLILMAKTLNWDLKVSDFIDNNCWDKEKLFEVVSYEVVKKICSIRIPIQETDDKFIWGPTTDGKFSIKLTTWIQKGTLVQLARHKVINKMQKRNIPIPPSEDVFVAVY